MTLRNASFGFLVAGVLAASLAAAAPGDSREGARAASASTQADARLQRALQRAVTQQVAEAGLEPSLAGYSLSPALIQLRRYAEPGQKRSKLVCIVSLALKNQQNDLVAEIRGNAASFGGTSADVMSAAAHSAVLRVPAVLAKLQTGPSPDTQVAAR